MTTDKKAAEKETVSRVKKESFICIQGWMRTELGLKGNDLLVYAIVYGFSQGGEGVFRGSLQYLADWTGATKQGIVKNLKHLMDLGLISKTDIAIGKQKLCEYKATERTAEHTADNEGIKLSSPGYTTEFNGVCNSVVQGIKLSCPNNIVNTRKKIVDSTSAPADALESVYTDTDSLPFEEKKSKPRTFDDSLRRIMDAWNEMVISVRETRGIIIPAVTRITPDTARHTAVCNILKSYSEDQIIACIKASPRVEHWINPKRVRPFFTFRWFYEHFYDTVVQRMELIDVLVPVRAGSDITYRVNDIPAVQTETQAKAQQTQQTQTQQEKAEPVMVGGFAFPE